MPTPVSKPVVPSVVTTPDPVWDAAVNAPVEPEDAEERRAIDAAKKVHATPVAGARVTEQVAERLRSAR